MHVWTAAATSAFGERERRAFSDYSIKKEVAADMGQVMTERSFLTIV